MDPRYRLEVSGTGAVRIGSGAQPGIGDGLTFSVAIDEASAALWREHILGLPDVEPSSNARVTVILLGYARMWNMDALTRAALKARGVRKVVVSNNNPDHRIQDHVDVDDPRVRLIDQPTRFGCGNRYDIARDDDAEHFLCIDDDIFLRPRQIDGLIDKLRDDPAVPHGLHGSEYLPGSGTDRPTTLYYRGQDIDVDVLHNIYAFTRTHVRYYFANLELGRRHGLEHLEICDDILLSHAAPSRPLIHDLGRYSVDPTWNADDVAVFRQPEYERSRDRAMEFFILRSLERALPAQAG